MPDRTYQEIWRASLSPGERRTLVSETGYSQRELLQGHLEIYHSMPGVEELTSQQRHQEFAEYLDLMVRGMHSRAEREGFFMAMGIEPADFDWEHWRDLMGYNRQ